MVVQPLRGRRSIVEVFSREISESWAVFGVVWPLVPSSVHAGCGLNGESLLSGRDLV
jgi:hypothetical protein